MTFLFISDLHLDEQHPEIADIFFRFLQEYAHSDNPLFILGDLFEAWIGDDDLSSFNLAILNALFKAHQKGQSIYLMHGNRDFLIGKRFSHATGCKLLPDEYVVTIHGIPTLLMHGDTLCTLDTKYLAFRKKSRTWAYKTLARMKSLKSRREIVAKMRAASKAHTSATPSYIMDVTQDEVERVMQKHRVNHLIHGHTHRPAVHRFELENTPATRTVLAPWHEEGSVLIYEAGKEPFVLKLN